MVIKPYIVSNTLEVDEDSSITTTLLDKDIDGDILTYRIITKSNNGKSTIIDKNKLEYIPNKDFNGNDHITLVANDCIVDSMEIPIYIIVKPINGGSSNGLLKIKNENEFNYFLKKNNKKLESFLFEKFIDGREITVGILDNKICGIMEIVFDSEIYDYKNKYIQIADHIINPDIPNHIKKKLCEISLDIHKGTNCNCISRLDFRYDQKKDEVFLLEVNTQPGLTKSSLLPEMAKENGINFFQLCETLIQNSLCEKL